ncbi:MAG: ROK family protein [Solobacterium sp.]|nr:ROK family protein [Solobacterium sp.]
MSNYLTIDVGGTNIKYALMDENAEILEKDEIPTPRDSLESFMKAIGEIYAKYEDKQIEAVCMSAPGRIDSQTGYFYTSGALKYVNGVNLPEAMKDVITVPFCVENDAKAAALAELWRGSMKGFSNGSVITLGTGIGGSVIIDGKLYRGTTFAAGEFSGIGGHWDERYAKGCSWAGISSTAALVGDYAYLIGKDVNEVNGRMFFDAVNAGDEQAMKVLDYFCDTVVTGIMSLQLILDLERYSIGGGISKQPVLLETINRKMDELFKELEGRTPASRPDVVPCAFGNDANMIGALYHYLYELK